MLCLLGVAYCCLKSPGRGFERLAGRLERRFGVAELLVEFFAAGIGFGEVVLGGGEMVAGRRTGGQVTGAGECGPLSCESFVSGQGGREAL